MNTNTIGSSDIARVLGMGSLPGAPRWMQQSGSWAVYSRLKGLVPSDNKTNPFLHFGNVMEAALRDDYAERHGMTALAGPPYPSPGVPHPTEPWAHARPDAWLIAPTPDYPDRLLEVKTCKDWDHWGPEGTDQIPVYYLAQTAWQMACCDLDRCDLVVANIFTREIRDYVIHRDTELEAQIMDIARDWYARHITGDEIPETDATPACSAALMALYPARAEKVRIEPAGDDLMIAESLAHCRAEIADLKLHEAEMVNHFKERCGVNYGIAGVCTWAPTKGRAGFDRKGLAKAHPEIAAEFATAGKPSRVFRFNFKPPTEL